ncbi:MAG: FHA domain-containing protein [Anaerolineales bacterium]
MIRCPQCRHANPTGAVFCTECGAILIGKIPTDRRPVSTSGTAGVGQPDSAKGPWATLYVGDDSQTFQLAQREEFTLGRGDESRAKRPDIDLSRSEAYANGVSRMHAVIRRRAGQIVLMDLDSANGTYVNGRRLGPRQEAGLQDGDVIALGALKIQVRMGATKMGRQKGN